MSASTATELSAWADVPERLAVLTVLGAAFHGLHLAQVRSSSRRMDHVRARWAIIAEARKEGFSYPQIGRALNRDHSTIIHGMQRLAA